MKKDLTIKSATFNISIVREQWKGIIKVAKNLVVRFNKPRRRIIYLLISYILIFTNHFQLLINLEK